MYICMCIYIYAVYMYVYIYIYMLDVMRVIPSLRVVHLGRSTCHAISGRGEKSTFSRREPRPSICDLVQTELLDLKL